MICDRQAFYDAKGTHGIYGFQFGPNRRERLEAESGVERRSHIYVGRRRRDVRGKFRETQDSSEVVMKRNETRRDSIRKVSTY